MSSLFGTDGIRGRAGRPPLDARTVFLVGRGLARSLLGRERATPTVLIGRDTRSSGKTIESWIAAGIAAGGGRAVSAGVITTPGVAHLTRSSGFSAGVVISASHNPYPDNGVKIFSGEGTKSTEELESRIEEEVARSGEDPEAALEPPDAAPELHERYLRYLEATLPRSAALSGWKMALDCAHGAGFELGPRLLRRLGMDVSVLAASPDGENINDGCGSTHPEQLAREVVERGCALGAALDGDGDRLILVDANGKIVDGDAILLLCGRRMKAEGRLPGPAVVATVMSNLALEKELEKDGIRLYRTPVGDKYVVEEMTARGAALGGEQSGHVVFAEYAPTGDGLLTLLQVLRVMAEEEKSLEELARLAPYPQVLVNVPVREKPDLSSVPELVAAIERAEQRLAGRGRLLVRYSGTEPLLRIMVEAPEADEVREISASLADIVRSRLE